MIQIDGQVDEEKFFKQDDWLGRSLMEKAKEQTEAIKRHMSPEGGLGLPELLDQRRLAYGIPDEVFSEQAIFNRVFVWQLPAEGDTYGETSIVIPEKIKKGMAESEAGGIIVGAGLVALDELRSHGVDLGHRVSFPRLAPSRRVLGVIGSNSDVCTVVVLQSGDVISSRDLATNIRAGHCKVMGVERKGVVHHVLTDAEGKFHMPQMGNVQDEY